MAANLLTWQLADREGIGPRLVPEGQQLRNG
jgi:hypothetical protein